MTRREVLAWLAARRPVAPDALRAGLEAAVTGAELSPTVPLPDQLALLGRRVLGRGVVGRPAGGRELAPGLLVADAFIPYAVEAEAEGGAAGRAALAARRAGGRRGRACSSRVPAYR